jgi:glycosyltransferase involved in cell wall biosynthesis
VPAEKVSVIYNAIDERFLGPADTTRMDLVRQRYQLDHPFVLYVGNIKPHKNVDRLIDAFGRARRSGPDDLKLIIIGDELSKYPVLRQAVHRHKLDKHVRFLGFQPHDTLAAFYRLARAFVFPSLYEGFGLPPLEAMACGTPVVTSNVSSLPEIAGGAALLVDPYDAEAIADGIRRAVNDDALRADLSARGRARARAFSWSQSVAAIHQIYMEVLAQ